MRFRLNCLVSVAVVMLLSYSSCFAFGGGMSKRKINKAREAWMSGYLKIQEASSAQKGDKLVFALGLYEEALIQFETLQGQHPEWKPDVIAYRIEFCKGKIRTLEFAVEIDAETMSRADLVQEVKRLRRKRDRHGLSVKELNARIEALGQQLEQAGKRTAKLQADTTELDALRADNTALQTRTKELERRIASATKEAAEAMEKTASATREKEALAVKVSGLEGELSKSIAKVVSMGKAEGVSSDVSKRLQVRLESLSAENQTLAAAVKSGADKLEASEKSLAKALSAQAELAGDLATQTGKVGLLGTRLETAENTAKQVASLTTALRKEKGRVQELTTRSTEREKMLKTTRKTLSESESKVKEMQRVVAFAEAADVDKMRKEIAAGKTMAVGSTKKIEGLKLQLLARTETEKRLIAERNKRLDEERAVRSRKREREKKLHGYLKAGSAAEKSKDTRQAVFSFKKVLEMEPDNADAHARIGLILAETPGKDSEAEQYLKRALELDPNHADVIFRLGYVQIRQEKMAEAAATMMRGSALEPKRADYRRYQGISFRSLGWVAAAESAFKDAFKLDSKNPETAYNLAVLLATLDEPRLTEAKEWYQKSLALGGQPNKRFEGFFKAN